MALRIPEQRARGKARCISCCICATPHPKDPTSGRMAAHTHQGRKCLGGDIPFERHSDPPMGKLVGCIVSRDPMPNRAHVVSLARGDGVDEQILTTLLADGGSDVTVTQWMRRLIVLLQGSELDMECRSMRRTPRLRLVRERRAT